MAKINVEVNDIAEDDNQVILSGNVDVLDGTILVQQNTVGVEDLLFEVVLTPKLTSASWQLRLTEAILANAATSNNSAPLAGIVQAAYLSGGANELSRATVRVRGLPQAVPAWPPSVIVNAPIRFQNRNLGRTLGIAEATPTGDLPDKTIVRLTVWCAERRGSAITLKVACQARTTSGLSALDWNVLNNMSLTLSSSSTPTLYARPERFDVQYYLDEFSYEDQETLRAAQSFRLYTVAGSPNQFITIYHASIAFLVPEL